MPVADALERMLLGVMPLGPEQVGVRFALGRTLAHSLAASLTHPAFDASAMDGYAVRSKDAPGAKASLKVIGESAAGWPFGGTVESGQAVRIYTGAKVPDGADAVIIQEDIDREGDRIVSKCGVQRGENVRPRGLDFHEGDTVFPRGRLLNTRDILYVAGAGHATIAVTKKPLVAILATGDELVEPSDRPTDGQVVSCNSYGIAALVEGAGATAKLLGIALDNADDLAVKIQDAENADVLVTIGGASVGEHDLVRPALEAAGATLHLHKVAMRPGKPTFFGTRQGLNGTQRIVGLPGNPLSAMIAGRLFLVPLIAALLGRTANPPMIKAALDTPIPANGPRAHYMRALLDTSQAVARVRPLPNQDSSLISALAVSNSLIVVPPGSPALEPGAIIDVMLFDF